MVSGASATGSFDDVRDGRRGRPCSLSRDLAQLKLVGLPAFQVDGQRGQFGFILFGGFAAVDAVTLHST